MRRVTLAVVPVLWIVSTTSGLAEDLADLIEQHVRGSDEARLKVIDAGVAAVPGLLNIMRTQEGVAAERAARALGWIAEFAPAAERRKTEWVLVNVLLDHEQPLLARKTAARSLWHVASEESVPVLAQFVEDPELGPEVLWSLQNMKGSRPLSALMDKMGSTKDTTRVAILTALGCRPDAPVSLFTEAAQDKAPAVRITALAALGKRPSGEVAHFLEKCINKSSSVEERLAAWRAYVAVGDGLTAAGQRDEARQVYLQALSKGAKVSDVVVRALSGLGKTGTAETAAMIGPFLDRSEPSIQVAAASALARLPGSQATQILVEELASAPLGKARPILSALAERADSTAVSAVIPFVRVSNLDVRLLALRALGRLGDSA
ncbi:MAG: HEAT repeat domain-containing protein, partial [Candidatus Zipacnadales bacterium]